MSAAELEPTAPTRSTPRLRHEHPQPRLRHEHPQPRLRHEHPQPRLRHAHPQPRLRHEIRDGFTAAGLSLAASIAVTALLWVGLRWLG